MDNTRKYHFKVKGNTAIYNCTFEIKQDSFINTCTCKAAKDDMLCWHRSYVLSGLEEFLIDNNRNDQKELIRRAATTRGGFNMLKYARERFLDKLTHDTFNENKKMTTANNLKKTGGGILKWLGIIFILFIIIGIIAVNSGPDKNKPSQQNTVTETQPPAQIISVTAKKLFADYKENEVAADDVYKGKLLKISGTVESINKDFTDDSYLLLKVDDFENIHCAMKSKDDVKTLRRGQKITVQGTGGTMIVGTPTIEDCVVVN